ncbi:unnamed protein product [Camellia sinensis]
MSVEMMRGKEWLPATGSQGLGLGFVGEDEGDVASTGLPRLCLSICNRTFDSSLLFCFHFFWVARLRVQITVFGFIILRGSGAEGICQFWAGVPLLAIFAAKGPASMENRPTVIGPKGLIKKHEFVRIIIQCLYSLGFKKSAASLESESGISYKSVELGLLESQILNANWDTCIDTLNGLKELTDETRASALFLVCRQSFLEYLIRGDDSSALSVLRKQISALHVGREKVHNLAFGVLSLKEMGLGKVDDDDVVIESRKKLLTEMEKLLPPPITLPDRRLDHLVEMAVNGQIDSCMYHNSFDSVSLYEDHLCGRDQIPTETIQILHDHKHEVWFVQFSNNGEHLASSSCDCSAIIWKAENWVSSVTIGSVMLDMDVFLVSPFLKMKLKLLNQAPLESWTLKSFSGLSDSNCQFSVLQDGKITLKHTLRSHQNPVSFVSWSPNDTMLLTCGNGEVLKLWDVETGTCKHTFGNPGFTVSSCAWFPDSKRLVCGSSEAEKGIYMWDCEGNEIKAWKGTRMPKILDLAVTPDGQNLISVFSDKEIRILNVTTNAERVISEEHPITSLSISGDSKYLIVNLNSQEIHMWDVAGIWVKPLKYEGHKQHKYVIRSCFGGLNSTFIASGSEDSQVYIWNRRSSNPVEVLSGHSMTVNCVSWNPKRPQMLASASDDQTIRVWGPSRSKNKKTA